MVSELGRGLFNLNAVVNKVENSWEDIFNKLKVPNEDAEKSVSFYTAIWYSQLFPRIANDYDGQYLTFGGSDEREVVSNPPHVYFDDFSQWYIFRAQVTLNNLVYTEHVPGMIASLVAKSQQGGWMPIFPAWVNDC
jgi:putative alpha-1,2-mannosidase